MTGCGWLRIAVKCTRHTQVVAIRSGQPWTHRYMYDKFWWLRRREQPLARPFSHRKICSHVRSWIMNLGCVSFRIFNNGSVFQSNLFSFLFFVLFSSNSIFSLCFFGFVSGNVKMFVRLSISICVVHDMSKFFFCVGRITGNKSLILQQQQQQQGRPQHVAHSSSIDLDTLSASEARSLVRLALTLSEMLAFGCLRSPWPDEQTERIRAK